MAYKDLDKILPPKPDLLKSDTSDIEDWDSSSESEAGIDEAAKMWDSLCHNISTLDQPTPNVSTHSTTALSESVAGPTPVVVGKAGLKVSIPQIQAPSPPRVNRVDAGPALDSTGLSPTHTITREKWLSKFTLHNIETADMQGRSKICNWQTNEMRRRNFTPGSTSLCTCANAN